MNSKKTAQIYSVRIGGCAGQGVKSVGLVLAKLAARSGYSIYNQIEYPSLIRGGHNVMHVNISSNNVYGPQELSDLIIALNQETVDKHHYKIKSGGGIIYNSDDKIDTSQLDKSIHLYGVPLLTLSEEAGGGELLVNVAAVGAAAALTGANLNTLTALIEEEFHDKDNDIINKNIRVAKNAHSYVLENYAGSIKDSLKPIESITTFIPKMVINGNEAAALGAIAAGMQFASIYPMSPISNILHVLAANQEEYSYVYRQPEDEIAAINMAIGASFAGARSFTSTSGGGFCLMTEGYGLAGITETPVVIVEGMRGSPGTGIPTWSEQGDLQFILNAHQGYFPRIVLTPGDVNEVFELTMEAFNLADKYQTPVVVLIDKNICENEQTCDLFDVGDYRIDRGRFTTQQVEDYKRYDFESDGISQRSIPGSGNFFIANSDEHDPHGYSTEEIEMRNRMMEKRGQKLLTCAEEDMRDPQVFGPDDADITIVSWGSNKGSILHALENFGNVNYLHVTWMSPFPSDFIKDRLSKSGHVICVECNYSGQLARLIREKTGIEITDKLLKYDGRQVYPGEIEERIKKALEVINKQ